MPHLKELMDQHEDDGLVVIGVHTTNGGEKMAAYVAEHGIDYPVAIDVDKKTVGAFAVDSFPDYYVIDRAGKLRFADLKNAELDRAVAMLLAEEVGPSPLEEALASARKKDKRVLVVHASTEEDAARWRDGWPKDREFDTFLRYEYELVLGPHHGLPDGLGAAALVVLDSEGKQIAALRGFDREQAVAFLEQHQVPAKDAETELKNALAEAKRANKRVLVHLGAPW